MTTNTPARLFPRPAGLFTALAVCLVFPSNGFAAKAPDSADMPASTTITTRAIPRSVFDYRAGKDPFFPNRVVTPAPAAEPEKTERLILKGITGSSDRRVALINDRTFTKGEVGEIKLGTNAFRIRVVDIYEKSVMIERAGVTNELPLVENLLPLDGRK